MANPPKIPGLGADVDKGPGSPESAAPRPVAIAAALMVLAACVQAIASIMAVAYAAAPARMAALEAQRASMGGKVPSLESLRNMGIITVVLAGIATVCAYLLFAYFLNKGRSWARIAVAVLVVLTFVQLVGISFPAGYTTVAQIALGAVALGLCCLPDANRFFARVKAARG